MVLQGWSVARWRRVDLDVSGPTLGEALFPVASTFDRGLGTRMGFCSQYHRGQLVVAS